MIGGADSTSGSTLSFSGGKAIALDLTKGTVTQGELTDTLALTNIANYVGTASGDSFAFSNITEATSINGGGAADTIKINATSNADRPINAHTLYISGVNGGSLDFSAANGNVSLTLASGDSSNYTGSLKIGSTGVADSLNVTSGKFASFVGSTGNDAFTLDVVKRISVDGGDGTDSVVLSKAVSDLTVASSLSSASLFLMMLVICLPLLSS